MESAKRALDSPDPFSQNNDSLDPKRQKTEGAEASGNDDDPSDDEAVPKQSTSATAPVDDAATLTKRDRKSAV